MKRNIGNLVIITLISLDPIVWLHYLPVNGGRANFWRAWAKEIIVRRSLS